MSTTAPRYAFYAAPAAADPLHGFAARWLGYDPDSGESLYSTVPGFDSAWLERITAEPRRYGFHATLKPPFRLAEGKDEAMLIKAAAAFASSFPAVVLPRLNVEALGRFLALRPSQPCPGANRLAADCVRRFDAFRAPAGAAELAKRRAVGLTARQETYLTEWGYPYVFDEFRLHFTLTGPIEDAGTRQRVLDYLKTASTPVLGESLMLGELCLYRQASDGGQFRVLRRFALAPAE